MESVETKPYVISVNDPQKIYLEHKLKAQVRKLVEEYSTEFTYDSIVIQCKDRNNESLQKFATQLNNALKDINEFDPPDITEEMNTFLSQSPKSEEKSRIEIYTEEQDLLIHSSKVYGTQTNFGLFLERIIEDFKSYKQDIEETDDSEEVKYQEPTEADDSQLEDEKSKFIAIRILPH